MFPLDIAAQNAALDALLSRDVSGIPTEFEVAAYTDWPDSGGVEIDSSGGYVRPTISLDLTDWPAATGGEKVSIEVQFADSTGPWEDTIPVVVLISAADSTTRWYPVRLTEEINVLGAATGPKVVLLIRFNTEE